MSRVARACVALCASAVIAGAATSCAQIFDLPDGTLDDGGDAPGSEGGTDGGADSGDGSSGDSSSDGSDGAPRSDADAGAPLSDSAPSGDAARDAQAAESGAGDGGAAEAGADCAPAALSLYVEDEFNHLYTADFADKKFIKGTTANCIDAEDPQHLAVTRAGHGWLLGENAMMHDLSLTNGTCSGLGTVTGGKDYSSMAIAFARLGDATTDTLYTCSPAGLGVIDVQSYAWSAIATPQALDHSLGCTVKQGRSGSLAVLASSDADDAQYTLYEVDVDATATATIRTSKAFGTTVYDDGEDNENTFDFAWSSSSSLYYLYAIDSGANTSAVSTYDPVSGDVNGLFDFDANAIETAAQSTCAQ